MSRNRRKNDNFFRFFLSFFVGFDKLRWSNFGRVYNTIKKYVRIFRIVRFSNGSKSTKKLSFFRFFLSFFACFYSVSTNFDGAIFDNTDEKIRTHFPYRKIFKWVETEKKNSSLVSFLLFSFLRFRQTSMEQFSKWGYEWITSRTFNAVTRINASILTIGISFLFYFFPFITNDIANCLSFESSANASRAIAISSLNR